MKKFLLAFSFFSTLNLYGNGKEDQLFNAINRSNPAEVEKLIKSGVNINAKNSIGSMPIDVAYYIYLNDPKKSDSFKILKLLINSAKVSGVIGLAINDADLPLIEYLLSLPFVKVSLFHLNLAKHLYQTALDSNQHERAAKLKQIGKMLLDHLRVYYLEGGISTGGLSTLPIELRREIAYRQFQK